MVADGHCSIVLAGPHDSIDDVEAKCRLISRQQKIARQGAKHRLDRMNRRGKNSGT